ncbi:hypothetical protein [Kitasatospora sp. CB02891]|uniref:hypothetical protein n=1 Tax=Kitasatospora sp. CB02891 TaxID=2020329 RepID=UPI000C27D45E|nr:hypothetical protein [Kitasatospora sp. CB02891]PJN24954.1 hypothetical protein CG736_15810 [Kitasatospora sp. CB02891]
MTVEHVAAALPSVAELQDHCRTLAVLDAILRPAWEDRYFGYDSRWDAAAGRHLASMRNGSGDEYAIVFEPAGAYVRGFAHEAAMSPYGHDDQVWPGVLDDVPAAFAAQVAEPAFSDENGTPVVTACLWRETADPVWRHGAIDFPAGPDPDGADALFALLTDRRPEAYHAHAEEYLEAGIDLAAVRAVFAGEPLTEDLVAALNSELTLADLAGDLAEIGHPAGTASR